MQPMFDTLLNIMKEPLRPGGGVKTDDSILLVYPPERELEFREQLLDCFLPALKSKGSRFVEVDLADFMFESLSEEDIECLTEDEFDEYRWMIQQLSKRVETSLPEKLKQIVQKSGTQNIIVYNTVALYPMIKFGEVLIGLRELNCRIVLAFPGEEKGGKLHFMNQPDGRNYLAVKLSWR